MKLSTIPLIFLGLDILFYCPVSSILALLVIYWSRSDEEEKSVIDDWTRQALLTGERTLRSPRPKADKAKLADLRSSLQQWANEKFPGERATVTVEAECVLRLDIKV